MKKYLWVAVIVSVLTFNIYAEENPFALEERFQQIDKDTDDLLDSLKKMYSERNEKTHMQILMSPREEKTLVADDNTTDMDISEEEHMMIMMSPKTEKSHVSDENETAFKKAIEEQESLTKEVEEERLEKVKQEQIQIEEEQERQEQAKIKADKVKKDEANIEEEKIKQAHIQKEAELLEAEKKKAKEHQVLKKEESEIPIEKTLQEKEDAAIQEVEREESVTDEKELKDTGENIVNINIAEEEKNALKDADDALLKAMQEVDGN